MSVATFFAIFSASASGYTTTLLRLLVFWSLPVAVYAATAQGLRAGRRWTVAGVLVVAIAVLFAMSHGYWREAAVILMTYAFVGCCVLGLSWVASIADDGARFKVLAVAYCVCAFLVAPVAVFPRPYVEAIAVLSFECFFAGYSFCVDAKRSHGRAPRLGDCAFFMLVDPSLVYAERARRQDRGVVGGALRLGAGGAVMLAGAGIRAIATQLFALSRLYDGAAGVAVLCIAGASGFAYLYCLHSGLASIRIGLLRCCGYRVQERYHYPFLAKSPAEFWRRWNIYLGRWFGRYLFTPLAVSLARLKRSAAFTRAVKGVALIVTFLVVGLLHDAKGLMMGGAMHFGSTRVFAIAGGVVLAWIAVGHVATRMLRHSPPRWLALLSRASFVTLAVATMGLWL